MLNEVYYAPPSAINGDQITLSRDERKHLVTVVRHRTGDVITIVDGAGNVYTAAIEQISHETVTCRVNSKDRQDRPLRIVLGVGLLKNPSRFDFLVEKATELGVAEVVPLTSERTVAARGKADHWNNIALAAMKQSGRAYLPTVAPVTPFKEFVGLPSADEVAVIAHEKAEAVSITEVLYGTRPSAVRICIGPEGGFSDGEVATAVKSGWRQVRLGGFRLRTETAAIVAVAMCNQAAFTPSAYAPLQ